MNRLELDSEITILDERIAKAETVNGFNKRLLLKLAEEDVEGAYNEFAHATDDERRAPFPN